MKCHEVSAQYGSGITAKAPRALMRDRRDVEFVVI
jgi:hypothetical protein